MGQSFDCPSMMFSLCTMGSGHCSDFLIADCSGDCRVDNQRRRPAIWGLGIRAPLYQFTNVTTQETCTNSVNRGKKLVRVIIYNHIYTYAFKCGVTSLYFGENVDTVRARSEEM